MNTTSSFAGLFALVLLVGFLSVSFSPFAYAVAPPTVSDVQTMSFTTINVTLSEDITDNGATATDFTISGSATAPTVDSFSVSGNTITLTLSDVMAEDESITLSYTAGTTGTIDGSSGNSMADFSVFPVTNNIDDIATT